MVASWLLSYLERRYGTSFNPLHCGAVVASQYHRAPAPRRAGVSIPFIAGQWSLRGARRKKMSIILTFQSPSLRGSGRFLKSPPCCGIGGARFNPLHCGAVVASRNSRRRASTSRRFQSPSLRGSGRFSRLDRAGKTPPPCFNPLHCGAVVASSGKSNQGVRQKRVSIPFIAGQWSLPEGY